jgi:hypothetical protein
VSRSRFKRRASYALFPFSRCKTDWSLLLLALAPGMALAGPSSGGALEVVHERHPTDIVPAPASLPITPPREASVRRAYDDMIVLEVQLDGHVLEEALTAYHDQDETYLPIGEIARLLTLSISAQPSHGTATGYVLNEARSFSLQAQQGKVTLAGETTAFDPALVRVQDDDLYVASSLLSRWLPLDFTLNLAGLTLQVHAREKLPLQARLEREQQAALVGSSPAVQEAPKYARHAMPHRLLGAPFIDQTLGASLRSSQGEQQKTASYTAYLTGDLAGMESALFVGSTRDNPSPDVRFTLARHDPDAGLLGPLRARSVMLGSGVSGQTVTNVAGRPPTGHGFGIAVSNRPITTPTSFDRHTLRGDLPPGWDVELYFNGALVGFQTARADGQYSFDEQPLTYGVNEFRLVFHGPLGQQRVEEQSFYLEANSTPPGTFYYNLTHHQDDKQRLRSIGQFDWGVYKHLTGTAGFALLPPFVGSMADADVEGSSERDQQLYTNLGLRAFWRSYVISTEFIRSPSGGLLNESGIKTRIGGVALGISRMKLNDFTSELFLPSSDSLRIRDKVRVDGAIPAGVLPRMPLTVELQHDQFQSGRSVSGLTARIASYVQQTAISNQLTIQSSGSLTSANGALQLSRRFAGVGLSGQLGYSIKPDARLQTLIIAADKRLSSGYLANVGAVRTLSSRETLYTAGLNKNLGRYGYGLNASYASNGITTVGMQFFMSMSREPRRERWRFDAQLKADGGAASVRMFEDLNANGVMDEGEQPIENAAIQVNGSRAPQRTDAQGIVWLDRLPVRQDVNIEVDTASLEDPYWVPQVKGMRITPRPGYVAQIDFPILLTSEIDGTVYLKDENGKRGIGGVEVELLNVDSKEVKATIKSSADGYYIVPAVMPGSYYVRISAQQLERQELADPGVQLITIRSDGKFTTGIDFVLQRRDMMEAKSSQRASHEQK